MCVSLVGFLSGYGALHLCGHQGEHQQCTGAAGVPRGLLTGKFLCVCVCMYMSVFFLCVRVRAQLFVCEIVAVWVAICSSPLLIM